MEQKGRSGVNIHSMYFTNNAGRHTYHEEHCADCFYVSRSLVCNFADILKAKALAEVTFELFNWYDIWTIFSCHLTMASIDALFSENPSETPTMLGTLFI